MTSELNHNSQNPRQDEGRLHACPPSLGERVEELVGGGRKAASPPPEQTPTRLRSKVKATERDTGLVRAAGTRRGRLLQGSPPGGDPEASAKARCDEPSQGGQVGCVSLLFAGVSSQSPFLTCKPRSTPGIQLPSANDPTFDAHALESVASSIVRTGSSGEATSTGTAPPLASTYAGEARACTHPSSPRDATLAHPAGEGFPLPRVPPVPSLLALKDTLEVVTSEGANVHKEGFGRGETVSTPDPAPVDVTNDLDGRDNDSTPRAEQAEDLPAFHALYEEDNDIAFNIDFHERPETPTPVSKSKFSNESLLVQAPTADTQNAVVPGSSASLGRTPTRVNYIMDEAFTEINIQFTQLANRVGLPFQQVINRFMKPYARTCSGNHWNAYQKYHAANKAQELARLTDIDPSVSTPVPTMKKCYELFQKVYPDTWQHILAVFEDADQPIDGRRSVGSRGSLFRRIANQYVQQFTTLSKAHGIETAFVMGGSVVHQDGGNAKCFVTPGAANFWVERCRASEDEITAHFMAHVFNKQSLENVAVAFDGISEGPSTPTNAQGVPSKLAAKHIGGVTAGVRSKTPHDVSKETDADELEIVEQTAEPEREDHSLVRSAFVQALLKVGCQWASRLKLFPWKGLPGKLASSGIVCHNYPDSVPFPGEERHRSKGGSKGISELSLTDCSILIAAFNKPKDQLYFEQKPKGIAELRARRIPVIIGAAPEYDSPHPFSKRMFADGTTDRKGLPRVANVAATRIKKRKNTAQHSKGNRKGVDRAASPSKTVTPTDSDEIEVRDIPAPPEKRSLPLRKRRPTNVAVRGLPGKEGSDQEVLDISSGSGSDFKPDEGNKQKAASDEEEATTSEGAPDSDVVLVSMPRKRKAVVELSLRPSKKRVSDDPPSMPVNKEKGKAPARPLKRSHAVASAASSDEEGEFPTTFAAFKPTQPRAVNGTRPDAKGTSTVSATSATSASNDVQVVATAPDNRTSRPKPRLVTKQSLAATQGVVEPLSMRRHSENSGLSTGEMDYSRLPRETAQVSDGGAEIRLPNGPSPPADSSTGLDGAAVKEVDNNAAVLPLSSQAAPTDRRSVVLEHEGAVVPPSLAQKRADTLPPPLEPAPHGEDAGIQGIVQPVVPQISLPSTPPVPFATAPQSAEVDPPLTENSKTDSCQTARLVAPAVNPSAAAILPANSGDAAINPLENAVASSQGIPRSTPVPPHHGQEMGTTLSHDRIPYPHGWYGPLGHGPQYHGYPGPYFGPYPGWGYPQMDGSGPRPSGFPGKDGVPVAPSAKQPGGPFDMGPFYYPQQPFTYPNGFRPPNGNVPAGSSEGGDTIQGAAATQEK